MGTSGSDGAIVLSTRIDTSGIKQGIQTIKGEMGSLTGTYKDAGSAQSNALEKVRGTLRKTKADTKSAGDEAKNYGKRAKEGSNTAKTAFSSISKTLRNLAVQLGIVFSIREFLNWSNAAGQMATQTEASTQRLVDIYGEASLAVGEFIDANANAIGMSKASAASFASVYGNLFSTWADQQTNAALTTHYLNMTAVVASKTGRTMSDVQERIRSGLLGNTEAVEDLGIFVNVKTIEMTDAFKRMANGKSWEQLDAYTQSQIRSFAILEQATAKYGNEVADTTALTRARFTAAYEDFQATWGQVVNKILMPIMQWATRALTYFTGLLQGLFGISSETVRQADAIEGSVNNQKALTDAVKETAKEQKKATAGFDELNVLSSGGDSDSAGTSSDAAGGISSDISVAPALSVDTSALQEGIEKGEELKKVFEPLINIFGNLETAIWVVVAAFAGFLVVKWLLNWLTSIGKKGQGATSVFKGFFDSLGKATQAIAILGGIALVIDSLSGLITAFSESGLGLEEVGGLLAIALGAVVIAFGLLALILSKMNASWQTIVLAIVIFGGLALVLHEITGLITAFSESGMSLSELLGTMAIVLGVVVVAMLALVAAAILLGTNPMALLAVVAVAAALALVLGALALALPPILDAFGDFVVKTTPSLVAAMIVIGAAIEKIIYALGTVLPPIIREIGSLFEKIFNGISKLVDKVGDNLTKILVDGIGGLIDKVLDSIIDFVSEAGPAVNKFVDNIISAVTKLINFVISGIEYMVNRLVIDGINGIINGINSVGEFIGFTIPTVREFTIPRFIPKLAQGAVLPPNKPFMAVVGDQKHGTNIEAPLDTIKQALAEVLAMQETGGGDININFTGDLAQLGRVLKPVIEKENRRVGGSLIRSTI